MDKLKANWRSLTLTILRIAIGWHFLYEGLSKIFIENWTAKGYLSNSYGFLSGFYHWMAGSEALLKVIDFLNIYGLIIIGLLLFIGFLSRISAAGGVLLLMLYYFAYPPFGTSLLGSQEGHFFIVNRNLIEALILSWLILGKDSGFGIDRLLKSRRTGAQSGEAGTPEDAVPEYSRREALKNLATLPFLGALGWGAIHRANSQVDVMSGATLQLNTSSLADLRGELPKGRIGNLEISRLVAGGNLIGGWSHSRDLRYVSSLFKAYNTEAKVYETLMIAEKAGINAINIGFSSNELMAKYKKVTGSKIKVITQVAPDMENNDIYAYINKAVDFGVDVIQVQGNWCDWLVRDGKYDVIEKMIGHIRSQGYIAGLGAHTVDSLILCEEQEIIPDYYMKTRHHDNYWSAHPRENRVPFEVDGERSNDHNKFHDNLFCLFPEKTVEFVNRATVPVMGFKVLAAGALKPEDGFNWAFKNGADFICVGMFDFQLVDDVNTTIDVLNKLEGRSREWFG